MNTRVDKLLARTLFATLTVALCLWSLGVAAADDLRVGTWNLVKRQLPDGTVLTPPVVGGIFTVTPNGMYHLIVHWKTPEGKPASRASIVQYQFSDTELAGTQLFGSIDDGSGKPLVYDAPGTKKSVPVKREGNRVSYQHPFDPPFIVLEGDTLIATLKDVFVDTWERMK